MKGVVFTEFLDMASDRFGGELVEDVISSVAPESGGAYTAVGTYPHQEMVALLVELSRVTGIPVAELLHVFGRHLFGRFAVLFPDMVNARDGAFGMMRDLDGVIHVEVRKLYRDAELPSFEVISDTPRELTLVYRSTRHLADFAEGLIQGCVEHYGEPIVVERPAAEAPDPGRVTFVLRRSEA
jgi:hypothetical protein